MTSLLSLPATGASSGERDSGVSQGGGRKDYQKTGGTAPAGAENGQAEEAGSLELEGIPPRPACSRTGRRRKPAAGKSHTTGMGQGIPESFFQSHGYKNNRLACKIKGGGWARGRRAGGSRPFLPRWRPFELQTGRNNYGGRDHPSYCNRLTGRIDAQSSYTRGATCGSGSGPIELHQPAGGDIPGVDRTSGSGGSSSDHKYL